jgi:hypothetical protein
VFGGRPIGAEIDPRLCFVLMPTWFGFVELYNHVVEVTVDEVGLVAERSVRSDH